MVCHWTYLTKKNALYENIPSDDQVIIENGKELLKLCNASNLLNPEKKTCAKVEGNF